MPRIHPLPHRANGGSRGVFSITAMISWIFDSAEYTELYHEYYSEFMSKYFESGYFETMLDKVVTMISPYVEKDPTAFCTFEEFQTGTEALKTFCLL